MMHFVNCYTYKSDINLFTLSIYCIVYHFLHIKVDFQPLLFCDALRLFHLCKINIQPISCKKIARRKPSGDLLLFLQLFSLSLSRHFSVRKLLDSLYFAIVILSFLFHQLGNIRKRTDSISSA